MPIHRPNVNKKNLSLPIASKIIDVWKIEFPSTKLTASNVIAKVNGLNKSVEGSALLMTLDHLPQPLSIEVIEEAGGNILFD